MILVVDLPFRHSTSTGGIYSLYLLGLIAMIAAFARTTRRKDIYIKVGYPSDWYKAPVNERGESNTWCVACVLLQEGKRESEPYNVKCTASEIP